MTETTRRCFVVWFATSGGSRHVMVTSSFRMSMISTGSPSKTKHITICVVSSINSIFAVWRLMSYEVPLKGRRYTGGAFRCNYRKLTALSWGNIGGPYQQHREPASQTGLSLVGYREHPGDSQLHVLTIGQQIQKWLLEGNLENYAGYMRLFLVKKIRDPFLLSCMTLLS